MSAGFLFETARRIWMKFRTGKKVVYSTICKPNITLARTGSDEPLLRMEFRLKDIIFSRHRSSYYKLASYIQHRSH